MFCIENCFYLKSSHKIENPAGPIFRAIISVSLRAKISVGFLWKKLELLFTDYYLFIIYSKNWPSQIFNLLTTIWVFFKKHVLVAKISWKTIAWKTRRDSWLHVILQSSPKRLLKMQTIESLNVLCASIFYFLCNIFYFISFHFILSFFFLFLFFFFFFGIENLEFILAL